MFHLGRHLCKILPSGGSQAHVNSDQGLLDILSFDKPPNHPLSVALRAAPVQQVRNRREHW